MLSMKAIRPACCSLLLFLDGANAGSSVPMHCLFDYAKTLPTPEMVASLKQFATENGALWNLIPEDSYQVFSGYNWGEFQAKRASIDQYCQCAYSHTEDDMDAIQRRFADNVEQYNKNRQEIESYKSKWFTWGQTMPEAYQVSKEVLLWSCDEPKFFLPEFDVHSLSASFPDIHEVLLSATKYVANTHDVIIEGGTLIDRHHEVIDVGRIMKKLKKTTELSVNIDKSTELAPKFGPDFLSKLEHAQKEGKRIYSYLEFSSGEEELHRYHASIKVKKGKDGKISGLEVYDPMLMVKLFFPAEQNGKATKLPEFYEDFTKILMTRHQQSGTKQYDRVKYKVLVVAKPEPHDEL